MSYPFFRFRLNDIYEDVQKLQSEMVSVTKFLYSFAEKIADIPNIPETREIKTDIKDLSNRLDDEIYMLKSANEEKIEKNDNNIRLIGFKFNEFADANNNEGIKEISRYLYDKNKSVSSDCLSVLYTIGYIYNHII